MLVMLAAHIAATVALTLDNRRARKAYECSATIQASRASRTMIVSGLTLLSFIVYHMLHFTARIGNQYNSLERYKEEVLQNGVPVMVHGEPLVRHNAWQMVIDGFSWWPATLFYVIAMTLLCTHLMHGVGSIFQTLGFRSKKAASLIQQISLGYSLFIWLGFISIPIAILVFGFGS
jgi:succinate dehydrogenase / fumarate reductase cytochrome b subunit